MNSALLQMRRIGFKLIVAVMMAEQLGLHCVITTIAPRKVTNMLRCHMPISIRNFSRMIPLSPLRDTLLDTHRQYNQPKSDREEVEILLKQINTNNTQLTACIQICHYSYSANFNDAATYLSTHIIQIFPDNQPGSHARCGCVKPSIFCRNVDKAQTRNGKKRFNRVDITHRERYFSAKEWTQLGPHGQKILNDCPKLKAKKEAMMSQKKIKVSSESTQNINQNDLSAQQRTLAAEVINEVMQSSISVTDDDTLFSRNSDSARACMTHIGTYANL